MAREKADPALVAEARAAVAAKLRLAGVHEEPVRPSRRAMFKADTPEPIKSVTPERLVYASWQIRDDFTKETEARALLASACGTSFADARKQFRMGWAKVPEAKAPSLCCSLENLGRDKIRAEFTSTVGTWWGPWGPVETRRPNLPMPVSAPPPPPKAYASWQVAPDLDEKDRTKAVDAIYHALGHVPHYEAETIFDRGWVHTDQDKAIRLSSNLSNPGRIVSGWNPVWTPIWGAKETRRPNLPPIKSPPPKKVKCDTQVFLNWKPDGKPLPADYETLGNLLGSWDIGISRGKIGGEAFAPPNRSRASWRFNSMNKDADDLIRQINETLGWRGWEAGLEQFPEPVEKPATGYSGMECHIRNIDRVPTLEAKEAMLRVLNKHFGGGYMLIDVVTYCCRGGRQYLCSHKPHELAELIERELFGYGWRVSPTRFEDSVGI